MNMIVLRQLMFLLNSLASYEETAKQIETDMNNEALAAERK